MPLLSSGVESIREFVLFNRWVLYPVQREKKCPPVWNIASLNPDERISVFGSGPWKWLI